MLCLNMISIIRTGILQHFSKDRNIINISFKTVNQVSAAMVLGNLIGLTISLLVPFENKLLYSSAIIGSLSFVCLYYTFKSYNIIVLEEFNCQRMKIFCQHYLKNNTVLTPFEVSKHESIFFKEKNIHFCKLSLERFIETKQFQTVYSLYRQQNFICMPVKKYSLFSRSYRYEIHTFLNIKANNIEILKAFFFTYLLNQALEHSNEAECSTTIKSLLVEIDSIDFEAIVKSMKLSNWKTNFEKLEENYNRYDIVYV